MQNCVKGSALPPAARLQLIGLGGPCLAVGDEKMNNPMYVVDTHAYFATMPVHL